MRSINRISGRLIGSGQLPNGARLGFSIHMVDFFLWQSVYQEPGPTDGQVII